jgi:hypothetical protein
MNLIGPKSSDRFVFVETLQFPVHSFVEGGVCRYGALNLPCFLQDQREGISGPSQSTYKGPVKIHTGQLNARGPSFFLALLGQVYIHPSRKTIFKIPLGLSMPDQNKSAHIYLISSYFLEMRTFLSNTQSIQPFSLTQMHLLLRGCITHTDPDNASSVPTKRMGTGSQRGSNYLFPSIS